MRAWINTESANYNNQLRVIQISCYSLNASKEKEQKEGMIN